MDQLGQLRRSTGASRCLDCGKCTSMCPLAGSGDFSARLIASQELEDEIQGQGVGVGRCLTCGSCEQRCPEGVQFVDYVRGVRELIPTEARHACPHAGVFQSIALSMVNGNSPDRSTDWITDGLEVAEEGEVALFVGCLPFFDLYFGKNLGVRTMDIARSAIRLLNRVGIRPVIVPQERCCGHDLLWGGDRDSFVALAKANRESFSARGVKHIVTTCAECCRTWRVDYPEALSGPQPKVEHLAEFLAPRLGGEKIKFAGNGSATVTYQDPCRLGRLLHVTESPRKILGAMPGTELVEMEKSGKDAVCCGTSGFMYCDAESRRLQQGRLQEAAKTGAETLVTSCPKCLIHFTCAQAEDRRRGVQGSTIKISDLTVLAASRLQGEGMKDPSVPAQTQRETGEPQ